MARIFDTTCTDREATAIASKSAAASMVAVNDLSGTGSALAMAYAP